MTFDRQGIYFLQLPYLNEDGNPRTVRLNSSFDAEQLVTAKTHCCARADTHSFVVTPIVAPQSNVEYQIGCHRV